MKHLRINETFTAFDGCYLDVEATVSFNSRGESSLVAPAHLNVRFNFDRHDPLTGQIQLPASCDLTIAGVEPELKPCRYCGESEALVWCCGTFHQNRWREQVHCGGCGVHGPVADTESEAVRRWNEGVQRDERYFACR